MFNLSQKYVADRLILKCEYIKYTPSSFVVNGKNNQFFIDMHREDSAFSLTDSYFELDFNVAHRAGPHARYADFDLKKLVNLGPVALYIKYKP